MKGDPKLTLQKVEKLRDALRVVLETDELNPPLEQKALPQGIVHDDLKRSLNDCVFLEELVPVPEGR